MHIKVGTLLRWWGHREDPVDYDDLGMVIYVPEDCADEYYVIHWVAQDERCHHSPQMIEESLYQKQMEIVR